MKASNLHLSIAVLLAGCAPATLAAQTVDTPATQAGPGEAAQPVPVGTAPADPVDAATPRDPGALQDVVVTARRRSESLQRTPIAVTALTGEQIAERGLATLGDVARTVPNVQFDTTSSSSGANFISVVFIRGVGQSDFLLTVEPGVGTYIDGVYIARNVGAVFDVLDAERVEVLRGPQGTLFGKNTIGGALSITTRKPDLLAVGGQVEGTLGNFERRDFKADISVPLSPTVAIKLAGSTRNQDGYVRFVNDPDRSRLGNINRDTARAAIRFKPSDALDINVAADVTRIRENGAPAQGVAYNCPLAPPRPLCGTYNAVIGRPADPATQIGNRFAITNPDADITFIGGATRSDLDNFGVSGNVELRLSDTVMLRSISAYRDLQAVFQRDSDNTPLDFSATANDFRQKQTSQEFQLLGDMLDERLNYVLGVYYLRETGTDISSTNLTLIAANNVARIANDSYAAFGQGTFRLTDQFSVTGGLRYTKEDKRLFIDVQRPNGAIVVPAQDAKQSFDNLSPRIGVEYQATSRVLAYASYSRGFKSGGFNIRYVQPAAAPLAFAPEELTAYEAGLKLETADRRLRLNTAVFFSDYENLQVLIRDAIATQIRNAAKAEIYGAEVEANAILTDRIRFSASVGYTEARYKEVPPILPPATVNDQIELSDEFAKTPKWTVNAALEADQPISADFKLVGRVDYQYRSKVFNDAINSELIAQDGFSLVNLNLTLQAEAGWSLRAYVANLFDKRYLLAGQNGLGSVGFAETSYARGREFGATARFVF
jgi:iron complex outermembrane receptor protein